MTALLMLEDGSRFHGAAIGAPGTAVGEVVFNTAMTGYQEILTDPSYARQIVTLTYPHIGNTGVNVEDKESAQVWAAGLVIRDCPTAHSNWRAEVPLPEYLRDAGIVAIADLDTRRLTRLIREKGAMAGCIATGDVDPDAALAQAGRFPAWQAWIWRRSLADPRSARGMAAGGRWGAATARRTASKADMSLPTTSASNATS